MGFSPAAPRAEQTPMALDSGTDAGGGVAAAELHKRKPKTLPEGGKRPPQQGEQAGAAADDSMPRASAPL